MTGSSIVFGQLHRGSTIAFLAGELADTEGRVLATATATARIVRLTESPEAAQI